MFAMTDVYIVTLLILGVWITGSGLAATLNFLLPGVIDIAARRVTITPIRSLVIGLLAGGFLLVWVAILIQASGPLQGLGFITAALLAGLYSIGAAAMSRLIGDRIGSASSEGPTLGNIIRGAVIYELACFVPLVGWLIFLPIAGFMAIGAAIFGLLGWMPKSRSSGTLVDPATALQGTD
jgi:hypothetical protein